MYEAARAVGAVRDDSAPQGPQDNPQTHGSKPLRGLFRNDFT